MDSDFRDLVSRLFGKHNNLPFKETKRNSTVRKNIIKNFFSMLLTDDERAEFFNLPEGCRIREGAKILSPEKLKIGEFCWIGEGAILDASGGLEIGSHTSIGLSVYIWTHSSHLANFSMSNDIGSALIERASTKIGEGCFISGPSVIMKGVNIGNKVLIKPFSIVDRDIPDRSIFDGVNIKENVFTEKKISRLVEIKKNRVKNNL